MKGTKPPAPSGTSATDGASHQKRMKHIGVIIVSMSQRLPWAAAKARHFHPMELPMLLIPQRHTAAITHDRTASS
jgi:hypothetical protein